MFISSTRKGWLISSFKPVRNLLHLKMAPVSMACRRSPKLVSVLFVLFCFIFKVTQCTILVYDRSTILRLQTSLNNLVVYVSNGSNYPPPPFLSSIPDYLQQWPCSLPVKRQRKKHGKQGGCAGRLKTYLGLSAVWCAAFGTSREVFDRRRFCSLAFPVSII